MAIKYPKYKEGDKILVKSIDWYNKNKDHKGVVQVPYSFISEMATYCDKIVTIRKVVYMNRIRPLYEIVEDNGAYSWSEEMFNGYPHDVQLRIF